MEGQEDLGAADGVLEDCRAIGGEPGDLSGTEAGPAMSCGTVLFHDPGPSLHSAGISPSSSQSSVLSSGPDQHSGEVAGHKFFRGILKCKGPILMQISPATERKKAQRWDEMNILATYHPTDKDYGFMKVDEPSTPYHRPQDGDEDLSAGSSHTVTPEMLTEKFATMENFYPKFLQHGDNRGSESPDNFSKTHSSDFDKHRKTHYNEGKYLKTQKNLPLHTKNSSRGSVSMDSGSRDSPTSRNQSLASATTISAEVDLQRKEYYSKGRYLRCSAQPEQDIEEDTQGSSSLTSVIKNSVCTEVRLLDHTGSPFQTHKATKNSL